MSVQRVDLLRNRPYRRIVVTSSHTWNVVRLKTHEHTEDFVSEIYLQGSENRWAEKERKSLPHHDGPSFKQL